MSLTDIIDALKARDIDAWLPGRHSGRCVSPYCVVADDGVRRMGKTTGRHLYIVTAYVPSDRPALMNELLPAVRRALADMDNLRETGEQSADDLDEETGAYYVTLGFSSLCSMV